MRIIVKILLSLAVLILGIIIQVVISATGNSATGMIRLIPGAIIIFGIIGVWRYSPKKNDTTDKTDLDKTL